ncbi:hypothetical protein EON81_05405 [bacterium]|nr:MAG: hypothetical protein EON81_05405 [bacterium]
MRAFYVSAAALVLFVLCLGIVGSSKLRARRASEEAHRRELESIEVETRKIQTSTAAILAGQAMRSRVLAMAYDLSWKKGGKGGAQPHGADPPELEVASSFGDAIEFRGKGRVTASGRTGWYDCSVSVLIGQPDGPKSGEASCILGGF